VYFSTERLYEGFDALKAGSLAKMKTPIRRITMRRI
jgi:hypothetical protein